MLYIILDNDWTQIFPQLLFKNSCQDTSAKFVDKFSIVGGTMGLLTGFSIISGIEIIYFVIKFLFGNLRRTISSENWVGMSRKNNNFLNILISNTFAISMWNIYWCHFMQANLNTSLLIFSPFSFWWSFHANHTQSHWLFKCN